MLTEQHFDHKFSLLWLFSLFRVSQVSCLPIFVFYGWQLNLTQVTGTPNYWRSRVMLMYPIRLSRHTVLVLIFYCSINSYLSTFSLCDASSALNSVSVTSCMWIWSMAFSVHIAWLFPLVLAYYRYGSMVDCLPQIPIIASSSLFHLMFLVSVLYIVLYFLLYFFEGHLLGNRLTPIIQDCTSNLRQVCWLLANIFKSSVYAALDIPVALHCLATLHYGFLVLWLWDTHYYFNCICRW